MSGASSFKFVLLPPPSNTTLDWAKRLAEILLNGLFAGYLYLPVNDRTCAHRDSIKPKQRP
jgi:hypothetical protein